MPSTSLNQAGGQVVDPAGMSRASVLIREKLARIDPDRTIFGYCPICGTSARTQILLDESALGGRRPVPPRRCHQEQRRGVQPPRHLAPVEVGVQLPVGLPPLEQRRRSAAGSRRRSAPSRSRARSSTPCSRWTTAPRSADCPSPSRRAPAPFRDRARRIIGMPQRADSGRQRAVDAQQQQCQQKIVARREVAVHRRPDHAGLVGDLGHPDLGVAAAHDAPARGSSRRCRASSSSSSARSSPHRRLAVPIRQMVRPRGEVSQWQSRTLARCWEPTRDSTTRSSTPSRPCRRPTWPGRRRSGGRSPAPTARCRSTSGSASTTTAASSTGSAASPAAGSSGRCAAAANCASAPEDIGRRPDPLRDRRTAAQMRFRLEPNDVQPISFDIVLSGVTPPFFEERNLVRNRQHRPRRRRRHPLPPGRLGVGHRHRRRRDPRGHARRVVRLPRPFLGRAAGDRRAAGRPHPRAATPPAAVAAG